MARGESRGAHERDEQGTPTGEGNDLVLACADSCTAFAHCYIFFSALWVECVGCICTCGGLCDWNREQLASWGWGRESGPAPGRDRAEGRDRAIERRAARHAARVSRRKAKGAGTTEDGIPIVIDVALNWVPAIKLALNQKMTPAEFGLQRVYWYEHMMERTRQLQIAGRGNGQFLSIIDFGSLAADLSYSETKQAWPYLKEANFVISANYGGCGRRVYLARLPKVIVWSWRVVSKFLPAETREKIAVVSPRSAPAKLEHFQFPQGNYGGVRIAAENLPACLGGTATDYEGAPPMHYLPPEEGPGTPRLPTPRGSPGKGQGGWGCY